MSDVTQTVEQELREFAKTQAGTPVGRTIGALLKSDSARLTYWSGSSVVQHVTVQGMYKGDEELTTMFAAEKFANMRACIGFVAIEGHPMRAGSWLTINGSVIDPAGDGRTCLGFFGVELTRSEAANWTPTQRHAVAERDTSRLAV